MSSESAGASTTRATAAITVSSDVGRRSTASAPICSRLASSRLPTSRFSRSVSSSIVACASATCSGFHSTRRVAEAGDHRLDRRQRRAQVVRHRPAATPSARRRSRPACRPRPTLRPVDACRSPPPADRRAGSAAAGRRSRASPPKISSSGCPSSDGVECSGILSVGSPLVSPAAAIAPPSESATVVILRPARPNVVRT